MLILYFFGSKKFHFFVSLYEGVVGFLPAPTCKKITFFKKDCQCHNSFSYLKRNHTKEQGTVLYRIYQHDFYRI